MRYFTRKFIPTASLIAIGYLIAQYFSGDFTTHHLFFLIFCVALLVFVSFSKFLRRIIYFPIRILKKVVFHL